MKEKYNANIKKYESSSKNQAYSANDIEFEILRDINEPTKDWFPFNSFVRKWLSFAQIRFFSLSILFFLF